MTESPWYGSDVVEWMADLCEDVAELEAELEKLLDVIEEVYSNERKRVGLGKAISLQTYSKLIEVLRAAGRLGET